MKRLLWMVALAGAVAAWGGEARGETVLEVDFGGVEGNGNAELDTGSGAFAGWTAVKAYAGTNEVRLGSSSAAGSLTSPSFEGEGTLRVGFTARAYGTDGPTVEVTVTADGASATQSVEPGTSAAAYELEFAGGSAVTVSFAGAAKKNRFWLSRICVEAGEAADPDLRMVAELDLGLAAVGGTRSAEAEVRNRGASQTLHLTGWGFEGDAGMFEAGGPGAAELGPGEATGVTVTYRPTAEGMHEARWVLRSDDAEEPEHVLVLRGRTPGAAMTVSNVQWTASSGGASPYAGTGVTVRGVMTYLDSMGWGLSDAGGGAWSGVFVEETTTWPRIGEEVVFDAQVKESGGETRLHSVSNLTVLRQGVEVPVSTVTGTELQAECWEGALVRVEGAKVQDANVGSKNTHWKARDSGRRDYYVVSRVPLRHAWKAGDALSEAGGVVVRLNGTNMVSPRDDADVGWLSRRDYGLRGAVVTPTGVLTGGWVRVTEDRIAEIGTEAPEGTVTNLDLTGRGAVIFPGLVDAHNHAAYNSFPTLAFDGYPYGHRDEWGEEDEEYTAWKSARSGLRSGISDSSKDITAKYGECLELMAGCVLIQGESNGDIEHSYPPMILRNVEHLPFRTDADIFPWESSSGERSAWKAKMDGGAIDALIIHLAEGTDETARAQFDAWEGWGMLTNKVTIIHGAALGEEEFRKMAAAGMKLVWSPMSNMRLYGGTANVRAAKEAGVLIGLSPDWTPSGCYNLLEELGCAWDWNCRVLGNLFTEEEMCRMVTENTAECCGAGETHGRLEVGRNAGLAVVEGDPEEPYLSLIAARPKHVILTVVDGEPRYGDRDVMERLGVTEADDIDLDGREKRFNIAVEHPYLEYGGMKFTEMLDILRDGHGALTPSGELEADELALLGPELLQGDGDDVEPFGAASPLAKAPSTTVRFDEGDSVSLTFRMQDFWDNATFTEELKHTIEIVPAAYPQYGIQTVAEGLANIPENETVTFDVACRDLHTNYLFRFTTEDRAGNRRVAVTTNGFMLVRHEGGDTDGDGIPNEWEIRHFEVFDGASAEEDADGDGRSNYAEWVADTLPKDAASWFGDVAGFAAAGAGAFDVRVEGSTSAEREYDLWMTESLRDGEWLPMGLTRRGDGGTGLTFRVSVTNALPQGYFRATVGVPEDGSAE